MSLNRVSSEEFSFPSLASNDLPHHSGLDSPPLWKHLPENSRRERFNRSFGRLINVKYDNDNDQAKSFSYVEMRSRWCDYKEEEKMDMLWEDLNEELPPRSQSLRIVSVGRGVWDEVIKEYTKEEKESECLHVNEGFKKASCFEEFDSKIAGENSSTVIIVELGGFG